MRQPSRRTTRPRRTWLRGRSRPLEDEQVDGLLRHLSPSAWQTIYFRDAVFFTLERERAFDARVVTRRAAVFAVFVRPGFARLM